MHKDIRCPACGSYYYFLIEHLQKEVSYNTKVFVRCFDCNHIFRVDINGIDNKE